MTACSHIAFASGPSTSRRLIGPKLHPQGYKQNRHRPPLFFTPRNHINPLYYIKLLKNPSSASKTAKNTKCLNITSTTSSSLAIILAVRQTTILRPSRSLKFWPGYLHLNPRDGTRTFGPIGSTGWATGFYKLRNIGIGLLVFVGVNPMVRPCFATDVRGLARPTLGKEEGTRGEEGIANRLWC